MTDLLIRIFAPLIEQRGADGKQALRCRVEARLDDSEDFTGEGTFDVQKLLAMEGDALVYGRYLRDTLLASPALQRAYLKAAARSPVRLRLLADSLQVAELRWERLMLESDDEDRPAATLPHTPFSRYYQLEQGAPPSADVPRLLLAIANPELRNLPPIDVEDEIDSLLDVWEPLLDDGTMKLTVLSGRTPLSPGLAKRLGDASRYNWVQEATTLDAISRELPAVHGFHLIAHGNLAEGKAVLYLEKDDGTFAVAGEDELRVKLDQPRLRFAFLHSCKGNKGNAGLGPRLVELGVPAVIAMQDFVPMVDARRFASAFYTALVREGQVDVAANAGRQAIFRSRSANWSIPALFSRLKDGRVWDPDPVRAAVNQLARQYANSASVKAPFPLDAVRVSGGLDGLHGGIEYATGTTLSLIDACRQSLSDVQRPYILLLGSRGRAKTAHLQCMFVDAVKQSTNDDSAFPLLLNLADCVPDHGAPEATVAWAVAAAFKREGIAPEGLDAARFMDAMGKRPFLFLVDGDDDIGSAARTDAIEVLTSFQSGSTQPHSILLTGDDSTFDRGAPYPRSAAVLVLKPMAPGRVSEYLKSLGIEGERLERDLQSTRLFDLAGVPWLLGRLIDNAKQNTRIESRSDIFERVVREGLARLEGSAGVRNRAEQVLGRIAWRMQSAYQTNLTDAEVYAIMAEVRGNRDFQLQQFLEEILKKSGLLVWSGAEGVSFAYAWLQRYYCAKYLTTLPEQERERCLVAITDTLGRLNRLRWWEDTLVLLAGLSKDPGSLLKKMLAGSLLTEGEQVFVAARCMHEAQGVRKKSAREATDARKKGEHDAKVAPKEIDPDVRAQIVDALVWRSRHENVRSTAARRKAIEMLSLLEEKRVIPHLVSLAIRKVRRSWQGRLEYDHSGIRLAAVQALFGMQQATLHYVRNDSKLSRNEALRHLLSAWLERDVAELGERVTANDPETSALAAFALGTLAEEEKQKEEDEGKAQNAARERTDRCFVQLLKAFHEHEPKSAQDDIMWAITDTLTLLDPHRVTNEAIQPLLKDGRRAPYIAYLLGRLGIAPLDGEEVEFLRGSLHSGSVELIGRALRAYAALLAREGMSTTREDTPRLRTLCHQFVSGQFDEAAQGGMIECPTSLSDRDRQHLQYQAFGALRDIGNEESIKVLREIRQRDYDAPNHEAQGTSSGASYAMNSRLSFDVAEQIYWRMSGGIAMQS
jgi:CHAT domain